MPLFHQSPARIVAGVALLEMLLMAPITKHIIETHQRRQLATGLWLVAVLGVVLSRRKRRKNDVFILAGQSNMAGRGGLSKVFNPDGTFSKVFSPSSAEELALSSGQYEFVERLTAELEFELAKEPLHYDIDTAKKCGIGPGLVFARELVYAITGGRMGNFGERKVNLVPCAVGGTKISEWARDQPLYQSMMLRANVAKRKASAPKISGLLWYQGESDALNEEDAKVYESRLLEFIHNVRSDIQSDLPIVFVLPFAEKRVLPFIDNVRDAIFRVVSQIDRSTLVDSKGLVLQDDGLHLTTSSQVILGKLLVDAYLGMIRN